MHAHRMVNMFALATLLPLTTLAAHRQAGSTSTVANKVEIIAYVFPRDRVLRPNEVAAKKLTRINYASALAPVILSIARSAGNVVVTWPNGTLQQSATIAGVYTNVVGATSPYTNAMLGAQSYFRVKVQ